MRHYYIEVRTNWFCISIYFFFLETRTRVQKVLCVCECRFSSTPATRTPHTYTHTTQHTHTQQILEEHHPYTNYEKKLYGCRTEVVKGVVRIKLHSLRRIDLLFSIRKKDFAGTIRVYVSIKCFRTHYSKLPLSFNFISMGHDVYRFNVTPLNFRTGVTFCFLFFLLFFFLLPSLLRMKKKKTIFIYFFSNYLHLNLPMPLWMYHDEHTTVQPGLVVLWNRNDRVYHCFLYHFYPVVWDNMSWVSWRVQHPTQQQKNRQAKNNNIYTGIYTSIYIPVYIYGIICFYCLLWYKKRKKGKSQIFCFLCCLYKSRAWPREREEESWDGEKKRRWREERERPDQQKKKKDHC